MSDDEVFLLYVAFGGACSILGQFLAAWWIGRRDR
jgi:hypothetical protein